MKRLKYLLIALVIISTIFIIGCTEDEPSYVKLVNPPESQTDVDFHLTLTDGINWLGVFDDDPVDPSVGDAYRNSTDGVSYIWNGAEWQILTEDGEAGAAGEAGAEGPAGPNEVTTATATDITGILKGDGSTVLAATAGTDYATQFSQLTDTIIVVKNVDETVNNSTTLQSDDELLFAVGANEVWEFRCVLRYSSGTTPDLKIGFSVPSGTNMRWSSMSSESNFTEASTYVISGYGDDYITKGVQGVIWVDSTTGNVNLMWAQNTAHASDTKILQNSFIIAHRLK